MTAKDLTAGPGQVHRIRSSISPLDRRHHPTVIKPRQRNRNQAQKRLRLGAYCRAMRGGPMRPVAAVLIALLAPGFGCGGAASPTAPVDAHPRPNLVVILADDMADGLIGPARRF